ncbi:MAG: DUF3422 family protein, partial [Alkalimonas sp.]|nr:DUF3422 family protein [Alkalimonas sp.]
LEQQNQRLLASMDQRARLQLKLQHMVEGLSVVAISYYAMQLCQHGIRALQYWWPALNSELWHSLSLPLVISSVALLLYACRRRLKHAEKTARP